ncbi:Transcriptional regulator, LysR family [plant metagenome]|uniref:Transcriptional regulator, LysR family n=1 Tax=plant metagenome TaxID=1297885 RepID=A0A484Q240_9ZZZZ
MIILEIFRRKSFFSRMKIDDIEAFVAVVRCHSLSQAAQELGLTQPVITRRIQSLEEVLGVELLDRNTKPPKPTEIGLRVREQCRAVLQEIDTLRELVAADLPPSGGLRLGLTQGIGEVALLDVLQDLRSTWEGLSPQVATGLSGRALLERVEREELDAAIVFLARGMQIPKSLEGRRLASTRLVVVGRRADWTRKQYTLADCSAHGWALNPDGCGFRASLKRALAAQSLPFHVKLDTYGRDLQLQSVAQGQGLGLVPLPLLAHSAYRDALAVVPVKDFKLSIDLWLAHGPALGRRQDPVARFGACVADIFERLDAHAPGLAA